MSWLALLGFPRVWLQNNETARTGHTVNFTNDGYNSSQDQPYVWVIDDVSPKTALTLPYVGRDMSSRPALRSVFNQLYDVSTQPGFNTTAQQAVLLGPMFRVPAINTTGFVMYGPGGGVCVC